MSISPRSKEGLKTQSSQTTDLNSIRTVIDKIKDINSKSNVMSDDISKTASEMASIAKLIKNYVIKENKKDKKEEKPGDIGQNKICRVYGCIYKGTYDGIIDGLKKVANDEKVEAKRAARIDTTSKIMKGTAKAAMRAPLEISKAIINLVAWERSEFLNLMRSIYHGVGIGGDTTAIYQQKAYRIQLNQEHDRKKLLKSGNIYTQNDKIIGILEDIKFSTEEQSMRERKFGLSKLLGKSESVQVELLRKSMDYLKSIEDNTGGAQIGMFATKATMIRWLPVLAPLVAGGVALGGALGGAAGMSSLVPLLGKEVGSAVGEGMGGLSEFLLDPLVLGGAVVSGFLAKGLFKGKRSVADKQALIQEEQLTVQKEIRDVIAGEEQEKTGIVSSLKKFADFSIFNLFKSKKEYKNTATDLTNEKLEDIILELEYNTDHQKNIFDNINDNNDEIRKHQRETVKVLRKGIKTFPSSENLIYQTSSLSALQEIEQANIEELNAIEELQSNICNCMNLEKGDDGIYEIMKETRQDAVERSMDDSEERKDIAIKEDNLLDTVRSIYAAMVEKEKLESPTQEKSLLRKAAGIMGGSVDTVGDIANIKEAFFDTKQKVKWDGNQVVSLTNRTIRKMARCINSDDYDLPGRKRRGSKSPTPTPTKRRSGLRVMDGGKKSGIGGKGKDLLTGTDGFVTASTAATAGAAIAAGLVGYGIGTIINKGFDKLITSATEGKNTSLGGAAYDFIHRKEIKREKELDEKRRIQFEENKLKKEKLVKREESKKRIQEKRRIARGLPPIEEMPVALPAVLPVANEITDKSVEIAKNITTGSLSLAKDMVDKTMGINWQDSLSKGWQETVNKLESISDSSDTIKAIKESQTTMAMQQIVHDAKSFATGGNATTNINIPIAAHDTDRQTNVLVHNLSS